MHQGTQEIGLIYVVLKEGIRFCQKLFLIFVLRRKIYRLLQWDMTRTFVMIRCDLNRQCLAMM